MLLCHQMIEIRRYWQYLIIKQIFVILLVGSSNIVPINQIFIAFSTSESSQVVLDFKG